MKPLLKGMTAIYSWGGGHKLPLNNFSDLIHYVCILEGDVGGPEVSPVHLNLLHLTEVSGEVLLDVLRGGLVGQARRHGLVGEGHRGT